MMTFTLNPFPTSEVIPALLGGAQTPPRVFPLYSQGKRNAENCRKVPFTCSLVEKIPEATSCRHGETKFLVVPPNSHVPPHTGQTNTRLVVVMGLNLGEGQLEIRLGEEKRSVVSSFVPLNSLQSFVFPQTLAFLFNSVCPLSFCSKLCLSYKWRVHSI